MKKFLLPVLGGVALAAQPAQAATLITSGGKLVGATGVIVGSTSYDVTFAEGTCDAVFSGCTAPFTFNSGTIGLATAALLSQVFVGAYDTPNTTYTCGGNNCVTYIPYARSGSVITSGFAWNSYLESYDYTGTTTANISTNTSTNPNTYWAVFSLTPPPVVPEPSTWALMILGFGIVGGAMRRREANVTVRYA
jgi:hypothetical protein